MTYMVTKLGHQWRHVLYNHIEEAYFKKMACVSPTHSNAFQFIPIGYTMTRSSLHRFKWQWGAGNLLEFVLLGPI